MAFSDLISTIFGGTDTSAQEQQAAANAASRRAIGAGTQQARQDVLGLFPQAQQARNLGFQGALDVLSGSLPAQLQAFQQGNVGAQQNLLAGLPQFQQAILGGQVDLSALQPTTITPQTDFISQTLPFGQPAQQQQIQDLVNALGGSANFNQAIPQGGGLPFAQIEGGGRETPNIVPTSTGSFDLSSLDAETLDRLQKFGGLLGFAGPVGSLANVALGQFARTAANQAFPTQEPIGFFEDIISPDILSGSPFEIQQKRASKDISRISRQQDRRNKALRERQKKAGTRERQQTSTQRGSGFQA